MKAWRAEAFGKPGDVLKLVDVDIPDPGPREALLRVLATNIGLSGIRSLKSGGGMVQQIERISTFPR